MWRSGRFCEANPSTRGGKAIDQADLPVAAFAIYGQADFRLRRGVIYRSIQNCVIRTEASNRKSSSSHRKNHLNVR